MTGGLLLCMAVAGLAGLLVLNSSATSLTQSIASLTTSERGAAKIEIGFKTQVQEWKNVLLRGSNAQKREKYWNSFKQNESVVADSSRDLLSQLPEGEAKAKLADFLVQHEAMGRGYRKGYAAFEKSGFDSAVGDREVSGMDRGPSKIIQEVAELVAEKAVEGAVVGGENRAKITWTSFTALLIVSVFGVLASVLISRSVVRQFGGEPDDVRKVADEISKRNLATEIQLQSQDNTSVLASICEMRGKLVQLVERVGICSDAIAVESTAVGEGSDDLARRRESQVSALADTSSSVKQLGRAVRQNAEHARLANELACGSSAVASKGRDVVGNVVATMSDINQSSKKIADIISVIDGIAFQTNLLALNAAVEAARAGEQGRGFAVVATEVRSLAQRSSSAADEIKALITDSVARVEQGSAFVDEAGSTMDDIVVSIQKMTDMMGEISQASSEQSEGVSQVERAIGIIDDLTTKNGVLVEQSVGSAGNLKRQSQKLVEVVSVFELGQLGNSLDRVA